MGYFHRVTSGVVARIDRVVSRIENHEALVEAALREVRRGAARAKINLSRVERDGEHLRQRLARERDDRAAWQRRALECRDHDEPRALECLRRAKKAGRAVEELADRLERHGTAEAKLREDVRALEERVVALTERHNQMRTRQACAQGLEGMDELGVFAAREIETVFERWEERIAESEIGRSYTSAVDADPLAREYEAAEELDALRAELLELEG